jgi:hypothetical protein
LEQHRWLDIQFQLHAAHGFGAYLRRRNVLESLEEKEVNQHKYRLTENWTVRKITTSTLKPLASSL